jgi:hypothetical protein
MATSNKSTGAEWNDLPLFAEGTPVSLSAQQVTAKVKKILVTCGLGYEKPLANYDLTTQSWKMSAGIFPSGVQPSLPILPPSGMTRNGALFQQPAWEPITGATASSLWHTPTAVEWKGRGPNSKQQGLAEQVKKWPTPTTDDANNVKPKPNRFRGLVAAVNETMWPTPTTQETEHPNAQLTATGRRLSKNGRSSHSLGLADTARMTSQETGKLNPTWVEWLMGFPLGWTDLED